MSAVIFYKMNNLPREIPISEDQNIGLGVVIVDVMRTRAAELGIPFEFDGVEPLFSRCG
jgi:hypothetical protein